MSRSFFVFYKYEKKGLNHLSKETLTRVNIISNAARIGLTCLSDMVILDKRNQIVAMRIGGYPESVQAMSDIILTGCDLQLQRDGQTVKASSKGGWKYQRKISHDGIYAEAFHYLIDDTSRSLMLDEDSGKEDKKIAIDKNEINALRKYKAPNRTFCGKSHFANNRGMNDEIIKGNMYRSIPTDPLFRRKVIAQLESEFDLHGMPGFYTRDGKWQLANYRNSGILIPVCNKDNLIQGLQIRLDEPPPKIVTMPDGTKAEKKGERFRWLSTGGEYYQNGTAISSYISVSSRLSLYGFS